MRNFNFTEVEWIVATTGTGQPMIEVAPPGTANTYTRELGHKQYEMSNHLGNCASPYASPKRSIRDSHPVRSETGLLVVVNDIKMTVISGNTITAYRERMIFAEKSLVKTIKIDNETESLEQKLNRK